MVEHLGSQDGHGAAHLLAEGDFLRRLACRLVHDRDVAADLVQEAWLVALQRRPRQDGSVRPWLRLQTDATLSTIVMRGSAASWGRWDTRT